MKDESVLIPAVEAKKLRWLLLTATIFFAIGIVTPMMTVTKFFVFENSFSVLFGALELLLGGHFVLFLVVAGFSILLPLLKIYVLYNLLLPRNRSSRKTKQFLNLMHEYGRWAMLDVMVVAVLIVSVKLGAIANIQIHFGLFVFGASVLLIMLITNKIVHFTKVDSELV